MISLESGKHAAGAQWMPDFFNSLDRLCKQHPGQIAAWLVGALAVVICAGVTVAGFVMWQGLEIDRMARATDATLEAHMNFERDNQTQLMRAIGDLDAKMDGLALDVSHVKGRLGLPRTTETVGFTARTEVP
jgi:uncharacterized protein HemX